MIFPDIKCKNPKMKYPKLITKRSIYHTGCPTKGDTHGMFLKGVYKIESDTKTQYEGF